MAIGKRSLAGTKRPTRKAPSKKLTMSQMKKIKSFGNPDHIKKTKKKKK